MPSQQELHLLEAAKRVCERWGFERVTIDDIAAEAGISRATLYRLFPGGKDVLFEAMRVQELDEFFKRLLTAIGDAETLDEVLTRAVTASMIDLRNDQHIAVMMATAPGETIGDLTVTGLPRIIRSATVFLTPLVEPYLGREAAGEVVELLVRVVISSFLAPSERVDFADALQASMFINRFILPAYTSTPLPLH